MTNRTVKCFSDLIFAGSLRL